MDYPPDKPIVANPLVLVGSDETPSSTSSERPKARSIPRKIANLIGKVGLRYEPSSKSDLEAHAARFNELIEYAHDEFELQDGEAFCSTLGTALCKRKNLELVEKLFEGLSRAREAAFWRVWPSARRSTKSSMAPRAAVTSRAWVDVRRIRP